MPRSMKLVGSSPAMKRVTTSGLRSRSSSRSLRATASRTRRPPAEGLDRGLWEVDDVDDLPALEGDGRPAADRVPT